VNRQRKINRRNPRRTSRVAKRVRYNGLAHGEKRSPELLEQTARKLLAAIKKAPGEGIEYLGRAVGLPTRELTLPVKMLLAGKSIRKRGYKRATKYFAK
jgi:hypothetical protein